MSIYELPGELWLAPVSFKGQYVDIFVIYKPFLSLHNKNKVTALQKFSKFKSGVYASFGM